MRIEANSTLLHLIYALYTLIPLGGIVRIIICLITSLSDAEQLPLMVKRIKKVVGFVIVGEALTYLFTIIYNYF